MKIAFIRRNKGGYVLLLVLVLATAFALVYASTLSRTATVAKLNERNNQWVKSINAAEAATEKVLARMRWDYVYGQDAFVTNNLALYRTNVPTVSDDPYWANYQFTDGQGNLNRTYVQPITSKTYTNLNSQYSGLSGFQTIYRVLSNVRPTTGPYPVAAALQQDVETDQIPVFQFAIFYNGLLEFSTAATMTVNGRTHANSNIYTGSGSALTFNGLVTYTGAISSPANAGGGPSWTYTGTFNGGKSKIPSLTLPVGTNNTAAAVHAIIEPPPAGEAVDSPLGQQRYYNKANVLLLVSNITTTVRIKNSPTDTPTTITVTNYMTNNAALVSTFPFLSVTNRFREQREANKTNLVTQINVNQYRLWLLTNTSVSAKFSSGTWPNIMYAADFRPVSATTMTSVRLVNGSIIPTNGNTAIGSGWTLATPNPLYVQGNYNAPDASYLASTNTLGVQPASLICDAFTVLSEHWTDSSSYSGYSGSSCTAFDASTTTINSAIVAGAVPSTGTTTATFSGGVHNLPRLLEDWTGRQLWLNTSIVCLYNSIVASNQFQWPGAYYNPPTRQFSFDNNFKIASRLPPGTPMLSVILRATWKTPPLNTVTYAGP